MDFYKKKIVFIRDIIFNKDIMSDKKLIPYFDDNIKELNKAITHIEIIKLEVLETKNIQLVKNLKVDKTSLIIICQTDYKNKDLDINLKKLEK